MNVGFPHRVPVGSHLPRRSAFRPYLQNSAEAALATKGSLPPFSPEMASDRFQKPNVREAGHAAEMVDASAFREWLLVERGSSSACCAAAGVMMPD